MHIDRDGSGDISKKELRKAFQTRCTKKTEEEWEQIMKEIDEDGNDKIDVKEFVRIMWVKTIPEEDAKLEEDPKEEKELAGDTPGDNKNEPQIGSGVPQNETSNNTQAITENKAQINPEDNKVEAAQN